ncbi:MAG: hypothetical protein JXB10_02940 [Pirellulales bacterium]|nr:hypothetical protein [Pirellulales bacterium]
MPEKPPADKIPLTLYLKTELAQRLQWAAESRKLPASEVAADLLDRYLPRTPPGQKRGAIPYT